MAGVYGKMLVVAWLTTLEMSVWLEILILRMELQLPVPISPIFQEIMMPSLLSSIHLVNGNGERITEESPMMLFFIVNLDQEMTSIVLDIPTLLLISQLQMHISQFMVEHMTLCLS